MPPVDHRYVDVAAEDDAGRVRRIRSGHVARTPWRRGRAAVGTEPHVAAAPRIERLARDRAEGRDERAALLDHLAGLLPGPHGRVQLQELGWRDVPVLDRAEAILDAHVVRRHARVAVRA